MRFFNKIIIRIIKKVNYIGSGLSIRLTKLTGKSRQAIHPKHLIDDNWDYVKYFTKDDEVLDVGCHNGQRDFRLSPFVKKITAFDYDEKNLSLAKDWQKKKGIDNINFLKLSAEEKLPFADNSFDKVLFLDVLEHLNNREIIMKEIHRTMKSNGLVVIAVPNSGTKWKNFQKNNDEPYFSDPDHKIEYTQEEIINFLEINDFQITEIKPIVYDLPLSGLIDLVGGLNLKIYKKLSDWKKRKAEKDQAESIGFIIIAKNV